MPNPQQKPSIPSAEVEFLSKLRPWVERLARDATGVHLTVATRYLRSIDRRASVLADKQAKSRPASRRDDESA